MGEVGGQAFEQLEKLWKCVCLSFERQLPSYLSDGGMAVDTNLQEKM